MKITVSIIALWLCVPVLGQTSLADYRAAVADYSWQLKIAASKSDAAAETAGQARTGYLPRLAMDGSFTATVRHFDGVERWTFSLLPQLVQTVYGGGAVRAAARQAELGYGIALCDEEFSRLDVRYAADYAYWNLSAVELYAASMRQYVAIIRSLKEVVGCRFSEGYIAKGDVLMIDARLSEAEYSLVSAEQSYEVALHNFNILRGTDAALGVQLAQGIRDSLPMPGRVVAAEALERRPDYAAARLRSEQAEAGIRAVRAPFNPQLSVGVGGMWQPYYPNSTGATYVDGSAFVKLSVPIFHWGERRRAVGAARAVQLQQEWNAALVHDDIVREEMNGWTALVQSRAQVDASEESLRIAGENLSISTYSYGEGLATILDVLQAQLRLDSALFERHPGALQLCRGGVGLPAHHGAINGGESLRRFFPPGVLRLRRLVLTTAISRDTGAILRSICTMPQYFSCVSSSARPTFAWSSSELHSTL